ncbi:MAG: acyltransferase family protein [Bacteroidota bacterium]
MDSRKPVPDILKGVAVLMMIQVHLTELFATQGFYDGVFGRLSLFLGGPPAAPVFMAVMGYFIMAGKASMGKDIVRGIQLIILGFALNIALNAHALIKVIAGDLALHPMHLVFGVDILFLAGLSIIIIAILKPLLKKHFLAGVILACIVACITPLFNIFSESGRASDYLLAYVGGSFKWSYFPLFPWLAYPLAGCSYHIFEKRFAISAVPAKKIIYGILILLLIIIPTGYFMASVPTDLHSYYHHGILFFMWDITFLLVWAGSILLIAQWLQGHFFSKWLGWIGRNVTVFYVVQWIIIGNLGTWLYRSVKAPWLIVYFFGIVLITCLCAWAWTAIRASINKDRLM